MDDTPLITLAAVDVTAPDDPAAVVVRGVDWRLRPGEFWVVGGDPGSGKTGLLLTAAALQQPAAGSVRILGRDLGAATEREQMDWRRSIGYVFEHTGRLLSGLTVAENVALPLQYHLDLDPAAALARAAELLAGAGLGQYSAARPSRLGPRLQQRVALLRALAVPCRVVFLDNPLGGLGAGGVQWWIEYLGRLVQQSAPSGQPLTVVTTCEDFRPWREIGRQFAVVSDGAFHVIGDAAGLANTSHPLARQLVDGH